MVKQKTIDFPSILKPLFQPFRYKVLYGGRGSGKSWSIARSLLILGAKSPKRILCAREFQRSIKDSVHRLISDQIKLLGLQDFYEILESTIRGKNGTTFLFSGLSQQTVAGIKSYEGIDYCWCEEAQNISKKSWKILIPTIRKEGSEIFISFNPDMLSNETYQHFVMSPPDNSFVLKMNYTENKYFNDTLDAERLHCERTDPEGYKNIWLGEPMTALVGAVYGSEMGAIVQEQRIMNVPYDPSLKVHIVFDLGWNDSMSIIFCQVLRSEIRIIDYIENDHQTLDFYVNEINSRRYYNKGLTWLPHDARNHDFKTGKSTEKILQTMGLDTRITPSLKVEEGIRQTRLVLGRCYFDKTKTEDLMEHLRRYKRTINNQTDEPGAPCHDAASHAADCMRYLAINADKMTNQDVSEYDVPFIQTYTPTVPGMGY